METLCDDELALILKWVHDSDDRKSSSLVCKQWLRVEGQTRSSIRVLQTYRLSNYLPRFPNLVTFESPRFIANAELEIVSKTCPNIEILNLNFKRTSRISKDFDFISRLMDVGDDGIRKIATGCSRLREIGLRKRRRIGDGGVISLVETAMNLTTLNLGKCNKITDKALEAIGSSNSIRVLNLQGCSLITDCGLAFLAKGCVSKTLKKLVIAGCHRITNRGVSFLKQMCCLEELN
ncbi:hypothetical protein L1049_018333 [Liquidambar formosana]|uniref:COI1 F-box domain-containing protein n=1 Tax=Liquidambar formosana TaxID=63359 RepID=A0AAP0RA97_LIQFO